MLTCNFLSALLLEKVHVICTVISVLSSSPVRVMTDKNFNYMATHPVQELITCESVHWFQSHQYI